MAKMKMNGKSNKVQGKTASRKSLVESGMLAKPMPLAQSLGYSYAYAVKNLRDEASKISGSKNGFLGVEKVTLNPMEAIKSLLPSGFNPKKK